MNIEVSAYGLGGGSGGSGGGGSYDDTAIKQDLARIKQTLAALPSSAPYDDTDLRKQISALAEQVSKIADTRKEYQAAYVARSQFISTPANNEFMTVKFQRPFSKRPFVKVTLDLITTTVRLTYIGNATETGFDIATNYAGSLEGVWYEAHLVD